MLTDDVVPERLTASKCPACWSKKVYVWAPLVGPFDEVDIECMSCGNFWIVRGDEAKQAIKWEYRRCGCRPTKISDEDAAMLDDDGNDIFKDDNKKPDIFTIYVSRIKGCEKPVLADVAAEVRDVVLKANPGYEITEIAINTESSHSEIWTRVKLNRVQRSLQEYI